MIAIVSGPPGSGKSTLAHALADDIGVPAIIRDEIKQGMVLNSTSSPETGFEDLNVPALHAFFDTVTVLASAGVSLIAEAAFQDRLWRPNLEPLAEFADIRIIHCTAPQSVLYERIAGRAAINPHRRAHNDDALIAAMAAGAQSVDPFVPVRMNVAQLTVDTTDGYRPGLEHIARFITRPGTTSA
ncbi:AAA family ATPase [Nocardia sp. NPDC056100]|uniref:AAA family ATPase n=1 Tax=Nocardia sp. NPDC056100 TaxID=3345712 RepID=UPI0035DBB215